MKLASKMTIQEWAPIRNANLHAPYVNVCLITGNLDFIGFVLLKYEDSLSGTI